MNDEHGCGGIGPPIQVEYVGPFSVTKVVVGGRQVPFLSATHLGGTVSLTLDDRYGLDLPVGIADVVVDFIANAIAVAMGFSCFPRADEEPNPMPPFPRLTELGGLS